MYWLASRRLTNWTVECLNKQTHSSISIAKQICFIFLDERVFEWIILQSNVPRYYCHSAHVIEYVCEKLHLCKFVVPFSVWLERQSDCETNGDKLLNALLLLGHKILFIHNEFCGLLSDDRTPSHADLCFFGKYLQIMNFWGSSNVLESFQLWPLDILFTQSILDDLSRWSQVVYNDRNTLSGFPLHEQCSSSWLRSLIFIVHLGYCHQNAALTLCWTIVASAGARSTAEDDSIIISPNRKPSPTKLTTIFIKHTINLCKH